MKTIIRKMYGAEEEVAAEAAEIWRRGGLVAFPTETVYGLGANGLDGTASAKIYAAKCRPSDNPLILHIASRSQLFPLVKSVSSVALALMDAYWPGPLTLIFPKSELVPYETTGGLETVAVRMPSHPAAACLLRKAGLPIAAPSANRSGRPSPTNAAHVIEDMDGRIDMIIDGGEVGIGVESTIVDVSGERPVLLRPGFITPEMLEKITGELERDPVIERKADENLRPKAPGMKYRHYAPKAELTIVRGKPDDVCRYINGQTAAARRQGLVAGVLASDETADRYPDALVKRVGSCSDMGQVAHNLFRVLREFDTDKADVIYSESFSAEGEGLAVMNRLMKAAGHRIIDI